MASGVAVSQECKTTFDEVKQKRLHRYVVYHIEDEKMIKIEKIGARDATYDDFLADLTHGGETECRYGLYDFEYMYHAQGTDAPQQVKKLFLMLWCPDSAKIKKKMLYSSSFDAIKKALVGVQKYIQATDTSEASKEEVEKKIRANERNWSETNMLPYPAFPNLDQLAASKNPSQLLNLPPQWSLSTQKIMPQWREIDSKILQETNQPFFHVDCHKLPKLQFF